MMRKTLVAMAVGWLVLSSCPSFAGTKEGVKLKANGEPIDVRIGHLVPCVLDWNNDGKKDLIVGQFSGGKIRLYLNQGTDDEPQFKEFSTLEAGGKEISLPAG